MTSDWTTPAELRAQVLKLWDKGRLLACMVAPDAVEADVEADAVVGATVDAETRLFPLRLSLRTPRSNDLSERFDAVREWSAGLQQGRRSGAAGAVGSTSSGGYRLVLREVRHRVIGQNSLPDEAWVDTLADALQLIGKGREAKAFAALLADARARQPALLPWLQQHPQRALALAAVWPQLLALVGWMQGHPRPGVYVRQVDLPGIHSKFIEAQRAVLGELLDLALPADAIDTRVSGVGGATRFAQRYGFRDKPARVRLRFLDPRHAAWAPGADQDYTLPQEGFARLDPAASRVFITENEVNFLAFPPAADSLVIFGAGYGFDALAQAGWLANRSLHYWGDIDTHGFAILDQLRAHFPHAQSFLMDRETLLAHRPQWTDEPQPTLRDLPRLTDAERRLYDELRWLRLHEAPLRLEQERVGFGWVERAVLAVGAALAPNGLPSDV